ncbi:hypothetical protein M433DRAFT_149316 [Acidomyces richmondensis BFW]|nr:MAG: hypothetical protein FE78DRAFT_88727 [Acidomyces sp. 'richmondensis']KYG50074.1 hypothetical protein M433DRAFT_149316 [Acidomyces richmondensis BFW]
MAVGAAHTPVVHHNQGLPVGVIFASITSGIRRRYFVGTMGVHRPQKGASLVRKTAYGTKQNTTPT